MTRSAFEASGREFRKANISKRVQRIVISPIKEMSILADEFQRESGAEIISFGQGIPPVDTSPSIKERVREALEEKRTARYTLEPGMPKLRELVAEHLEKEKGVENVQSDKEVMIGTGCQEAMACALATVLDEGDEALLLSPAFASHIEQVLQLGGVPVFVPLSEEKGWGLDPSLLEEKITEKTKAIVFSNPSNPTGAVFQEEDVRAIADMAKKHDLVILSDETYDFLTYGGVTHACPASFPDVRDRVIVCGSFSKKYALTGYRVGYAFAESGILDHMLKVHDALTICAPAISQEAAIAALEGPQDSVEGLRKQMASNRELMQKKFDELGGAFSYQSPRGAYYILAQYHVLSETNSFDLALRILKEAHVITIPGEAFGPGGEGHLRFSFACTPEEIEEGFERLRTWLEKNAV